LWVRVRNMIAFVILICWVASAAGWVLDPHRFYRSYLVGFLLAISIPLGALFFVMVQYLTGSAWSVPMRRIAENLMMTLPMGAILFIPVVLGIHELYEWSHVDVVRNDPLLSQKAGYLNETWFVIRAAIYFVLWIVWSFAIYRHSTRQDADKSLEHMHGASRWSAPGLLMLFLSASFAAIDWIMSLQPHWYSTMWGFYYLTGAALGFMCVWILICLGLRQRGVLANEIRIEHYHDFGKWLFCLTCFWGYIAFSQYMLIWYGNLPEETIWFRFRKEGLWRGLFFLLVWGHFIIPFVVLMSRAAKRNLRMLTIASVWMLFMELCDLYFMVMPAFYKSLALHWLDVACLGATLSAMAMAFWFRMRAHSILAVGDPRLLQGLEFENI
jgi:hypothetical protein